MRIIILLIMCLAVLGCGVPQSEHDSVIQELESLKQTSSEEKIALEASLSESEKDATELLKYKCQMEDGRWDALRALMLLQGQNEISEKMAELGVLPIMIGIMSGNTDISDEEIQKVDDYDKWARDHEFNMHLLQKGISNEKLSKALNSDEMVREGFDKVMSEGFSLQSLAELSVETNQGVYPALIEILTYDPQKSLTTNEELYLTRCRHALKERESKEEYNPKTPENTYQELIDSFMDDVIDMTDSMQEEADRRKGE